MDTGSKQYQAALVPVITIVYGTSTHTQPTT